MWPFVIAAKIELREVIERMKLKMAKKLLALLLALIMVISMVACGNESASVETDDPKVDTPVVPEATKTDEIDPSTVEFSVMMQASIEDATQMPIIQVFEEVSGYSPEYIEVSPAAAAEQLQLTWLSEDLPDVLIMGYAMTDAEVTRAATEGQIIDLAPYMTEEIMPNFCKAMQDFEWEAISDSEGHIYYFPWTINNRLQSGFCINVEWLDKLGLEMPETPDELMEVWRAFKEKDPNGNGLADEIPFGSELIFDNAMETLDPVFGMFGTVGGWQVDENGKVFFGQTTENYKEGIKWFREAYQAGLIDAEIFTQDMTSFTAKGQTNPPTYGSTLSFTFGALNRVHTEETLSQYDHMLPMKAADGVRYWKNWGAYATAPSIAAVITSSCENVEAVCRWIDCMYDPQVGMQIDAAPYGYGLTRVEEGENAGKYLSGADACPEADFGEYKDYATWRGAMHYNHFPRILSDYALNLWGMEVVTNLTSQVWINQDILYRENCTLSNYLNMDGANDEEAEVEAIYLEEFNSYWRSTVASWITGNGDVDAEWEDFQEGLISMGLEELTATYQSRYDRKVG